MFLIIIKNEALLFPCIHLEHWKEKSQPQQQHRTSSCTEATKFHSLRSHGSWIFDKLYQLAQLIQQNGWPIMQFLHVKGDNNKSFSSMLFLIRSLNISYWQLKCLSSALSPFIWCFFIWQLLLHNLSTLCYNLVGPNWEYYLTVHLFLVFSSYLKLSVTNTLQLGTSLNVFEDHEWFSKANIIWK